MFFAWTERVKRDIIKHQHIVYEITKNKSEELCIKQLCLIWTERLRSLEKESRNLSLIHI